jgi:hypothetical protein
MSETKDTVAAMKAMRSNLEQELMSNPDFRALRALEEAIRAREKDPAAINGGAITHQPERPLSHGDAAYTALLESGRPMPTNELLEAVSRMGVRIGGTNPSTNFSSGLSRDRRFKSVHWNNSRRWWVADRSPPPDPARDDRHS